MKNLTGTTLQWKGQNYNPGDEVPDAIAQEMGLPNLPDQIAGQKAQEGSEIKITDPYDPLALAAAQNVSPPINPSSREIDTTQQSTPSVAYGSIVNFGAQSLPVNLKPLEEASNAPPPEQEQTEQGKSESEALVSLVEQSDPTLKTLQDVKETEEEAAETQGTAINQLEEAIAETTGEEPPPETSTKTTRTSKK